MSAMASMLLIGGGIVLYIALMAFVLALVTAAGRAEEAAEHARARALAARSDPLERPDGKLRVGELRVGLFTAEHAELLGQLQRPAAQDFEYRRSARERPPFGKNAPWDRGM